MSSTFHAICVCLPAAVPADSNSENRRRLRSERRPPGRWPGRGADRGLPRDRADRHAGGHPTTARAAAVEVWEPIHGLAMRIGRAGAPGAARRPPASLPHPAHDLPRSSQCRRRRPAPGWTRRTPRERQHVQARQPGWTGTPCPGTCADRSSRHRTPRRVSRLHGAPSTRRFEACATTPGPTRLIPFLDHNPQIRPVIYSTDEIVNSRGRATGLPVGDEGLVGVRRVRQVAWRRR